MTRRATLGFQFDYRYTLAHISRYVEVEASDDGSTWCRVIPLCHSVYGKNSTVTNDYPKTPAELLATPCRPTWKYCAKCLRYAQELAEEALR